MDPETIFKRIKDVQYNNKSIVVLPDFFIDRIIRIDNLDEFLVHLKEKTKYGGGSIRGIPTRQIEGGNAVNIAYILGKLGFNVNLFTISDDSNQIILKYFFQNLPNVRLHLSHGKPGFTTSIEIHNQIESSDSNIMISDVGDNSNYGPERLFSSDTEEILNNSDIVVFVNWASNLKGTELLKYVFKNSSRAFHFVDPADIQTRSKEFCKVLKESNNLVHVLSINENECNSLLVELNLHDLILNKKYNQKNIKLATKELAQNLKVFIDLHTRYGSAFSNGKQVFFADTIKNTSVKNLTGAGDSWDSADIIGYIIGLAPQQRLYFSNTFASFYISMTNRRSISIEKFFDYYCNIYNKEIKE